MYKLLPHTADARLYVTSPALKGLFSSALKGMAEIIKEGACKKGVSLNVKNNIKVEAFDATTLLIDFLSEILTKTYEQNTIYCSIKFYKLTETELKADILGKRAEKFDTDVKAVTYHEAQVSKNKRGQWESIIIFDI
jgi:SHS2 domain-containing protein